MTTQAYLLIGNERSRPRERYSASVKSRASLLVFPRPDSCAV